MGRLLEPPRSFSQDVVRKPAHGGEEANHREQDKQNRRRVYSLHGYSIVPAGSASRIESLPDMTLLRQEKRAERQKPAATMWPPASVSSTIALQPNGYARFDSSLP